MKNKSDLLIALGTLIYLIMIVGQILIRLTTDPNFSFDFIFLFIPAMLILIGAYPVTKDKDDDEEEDKKDDNYDDPTRP